MVVALYLIALAMVVGGAAAAAQGYVYVMVEFGWSMVIAGSVVATGGMVLFGLAHIAARLKRLEAAAGRAADRIGRAPVNFPEAPDGLSRLSGPAIPAVTVPTGGGLTGHGLGAGVAAAGAAALAARAEPPFHADIPAQADPPVDPPREPAIAMEPSPAPEAQLPDMEPVPAPPAPAEDAANERIADAAPEIPSVPILTPQEIDTADGGEPVVEAAKESDKPFTVDETALVELPDLPKPAVEEPRPFPPQTEPVDRLPLRENLFSEDEKQPEPVDEQPSRGFRLRDIFSGRSGRDGRSSAPLPEPPPLPPFSMRSDPPLAAPQTPSEPEPEPEREAEIERIEPVVDEAPPRSEEEGASEEPAVVGTYMSGGNQYVMYADGSIEAETPTGRYRFKSLEELKEFIETGAETPAT